MLKVQAEYSGGSSVVKCKSMDSRFPEIIWESGVDKWFAALYFVISASSSLPIVEFCWQQQDDCSRIYSCIVVDLLPPCLGILTLVSLPIGFNLKVIFCCRKFITKVQGLLVDEWLTAQSGTLILHHFN